MINKFSFSCKLLLIYFCILLQSCGDSSTEIKYTELVQETPLKSSTFCEGRSTLSVSNFDTEFPYNDSNHNGELAETLLTSFVVKEPAGVPAINYPISVVFPLPFSEYFHVGDFHIKNGA